MRHAVKLVHLFPVRVDVAWIRTLQNHTCVAICMKKSSVFSGLAARWFAAFSLLLGSTLPATAQAVLVDEGTFEHFVGQQRVGTETFTIHRVGLGADSELLANGTVEQSDRRLTPALKTRSDLTPTSYQVAATGATPRQLSIVLGGPRYASRSTGPEGEVQREYRAGPGTTVLEEGVAHQFYFVARGSSEPGSRLLVIRPLDGRQVPLRFTSSTRENLRWGREVVSTLHVSFDLDGAQYELWADDEGRVLRVTRPADGWRAERVPVR